MPEHLDAVGHGDVASVKNIAIAIKSMGRGNHIGLIFRSEDGTHKLLHLAFHHDLKLDSVSSSYNWLLPALDDREQRALAAAAAEIAAFNVGGPVQYSPYYTGRYFESDSTYSRHKPGEGLTCATFVLEMFERLGFELLQLATYKPRPVEDEEFRSFVLEGLRGNNAELAHIAAIEKDRLEIRIKPEEVAVSAASDDRPLTFDDAIPAAARLNARLTSNLSDQIVITQLI